MISRSLQYTLFLIISLSLFAAENNRIISTPTTDYTSLNVSNDRTSPSHQLTPTLTTSEFHKTVHCSVPTWLARFGFYTAMGYHIYASHIFQDPSQTNTYDTVSSLLLYVAAFEASVYMNVKAGERALRRKINGNWGS